MKSRIFSIRDFKTESFSPPFTSRTLGEAQRSFSELVNDGRSTPSKYPQDFALYEVGQWDLESGLIESKNPITLIQQATEIKQSTETKPNLKEA